MTHANLPNRPKATAKFAKIYAGAWISLATLAIAYMTTLAVQPNVAESWNANRATPEANDPQRSAARFATDIGGLKQAVDGIQKDMTSLRTAVMSTASRDKEIFERLTAVEERTKPAQVVAEVVPPKTAIQRQAEARAAKVAAAQAAATAKTVSAPAAATAGPQAVVTDMAGNATQFTVLNAQAAPTPPTANPISTGSILPPPAQGVAPPPAPVAAPAGTFGPGAIKVAAPAALSGVELASGPSLDALRLNWSLLSERHSPSLKHLEPRYTNAGEGQPYQLVAGPIASPEEAVKVCAQLKAKKVACRVTGFVGNAL